MASRCGVEAAPLRAGPHEAAEQVTQALRGEPLEVAERAGGWARVTTAYAYGGWVREEALVPDSPFDVARGFLGAPYEWGGLTGAGIDCSGLVHIAFRLCGRLVPRDAWQQEAAGAPVAGGEAGVRPGDLVAYGDGSAGRADHVAFWAGGGAILHATARDGVGVVEEPEPEELRARRRGFFRL